MDCRLPQEALSGEIQSLCGILVQVRVWYSSLFRYCWNVSLTEEHSEMSSESESEFTVTCDAALAASTDILSD